MYIIDLLGLAQGLILGGLLLLAHRKEKRPTRLLGLFLITYTVEIIPSLVNDLGYMASSPALSWLPLNFYFLSLPLLYLYGRRITGKLRWRKDWKHLIPGGLEFVLFASIMLLEAGGDNILISTEVVAAFQAIIMIVSLVYAGVYCVLLLRLLYRHREELLQVHSNTAGKELHWLFNGTLVLMAFLLFIFLDIIVLSSTTWLSIQTNSLIITVLNVFIIYWFAIAGMRQIGFRMMPGEETKMISEKLAKSTSAEVKDVELTPNLPNPAYHRLQDYMTVNEPWRNDQLTILDLANQLNTSERSLSRLINAEANVHFNGFINRYRLDAARRMLTDARFSHYTMEGIALEAGFNSRATFYSAFRREMNCTPTAYKQQAVLES